MLNLLFFGNQVLTRLWISWRGGVRRYFVILFLHNKLGSIVTGQTSPSCYYLYLKFYHIAVLDDIFFPFRPRQTFFPRFGVGAGGKQILIIYHFGADEFIFEIGV